MTTPLNVAKASKNTYQSNFMPLVIENGRAWALQNNYSNALKNIKPDSFERQNVELEPSLTQTLKGSVPFYAFFGALEGKKLIGGFRFKDLLLHPIKWGRGTKEAILGTIANVRNAVQTGAANLKFIDYMKNSFANFKGTTNLAKSWNFLKMGGFKGWAIFGALFESVSMIRTGLTHGFTSFNMVKQAGKSSVKVASGAAGWIGGAAAGAGIGAWVGGLIGSIVGPAGTVVGAAIGKFVGGAVGGITGNYCADKVAKNIVGKDEYELPAKA